jgi:hypothetical protein
MNKKHGVGCTTLTYNLGKLFDIPIFVHKDSFMVNIEYKEEIFPSVSKLSATKKFGIYDIGADFNNKYVSKLITMAKVIVIPLDLGYESILSTIDTIKHIKNIEKNNIPIVLVLNRLDKNNGVRDYNYTYHLKDKIQDEIEKLYPSNSENKPIFTYLRNSYGIFSDFEEGSYFMNKLMTPYWENCLEGIKIAAKKWRFKNTYTIKNDGLFGKNNLYYRVSIEYRYFLNIAFENFHKRLSKKRNKQENQDIDYISFRKSFIQEYKRYMCNEAYSKKYMDSNYTKSKETKLIRDMAFISHSIFKYLGEEQPNNYEKYTSKIDFSEIFSFNPNLIQEKSSNINYDYGDIQYY